MAQPKQQKNKKQNSNNKKRTVYAPKAPSATLYERLDKFFNNRSRGLLITIFSLYVLFALLMFRARMDIGGDDSGYILRAYNFIHKGIFPTYQGPLYPLILSVFIVLFGGIKIVLLKFLSVIFVFFTLFFTYKTFKNRIPDTVFYTVLFLTAINSYILRFASLTYSEACFMFLQAVMFFYFFRLYDKLKSLEKVTIKETYVEFLLAALFVFLLSLSRSVGLFAFPGLVLFFLFRKEFKNALYFIGAFLSIEFVVDIIKKLVWHVSSQWGSERSALMLKNQYNPAEGTENFTGFIHRFIGNSNLYLSKRFFQVIGLRSPDSMDVSGALTIFFVLFCLFVLYRAIKSRNQYILIITIYTGAMLGATFLAVQTSIDQPRFVMVYLPLILIMFLFAIYDALKKKSWAAQSLLVYVIIILVIAGCTRVFQATKENIPALSKNLHGDISYGFTPDWANYIKMSQWCADNLPKDAKVAARKAEISFMYTDKEMFFAVYKPYSTDADTVLSFFKRNNVNYVMLASLRGNPKVADGNIITTMWRMMEPVAKKYPQKLKLVHREGESEPTYLYQIVQ